MRMNKIHLVAILFSALFLRLLTLGAYPLMDTTEARYGEMARLMVETANWITPQFDYGVPFWGKPPLFTWMSATGIMAFGVNEFAVRIPHWLAGIAVLLLVSIFAKRIGFSALLSSTIIATSGIFLIALGAVMTDMALTLGLTLALVGFYWCWYSGDFSWGIAGFIGLAIGLLAKGPLVIVLFGATVLPWLFIQHGLTGGMIALWRRFPLVWGSLVLSIIVVPWYIMAELATPGFLDYFIVGEHINRFLMPGWEGDLYGTAHDEPRGTIWLFWFYAAAPWSLVLPILLYKRRHCMPAVLTQHSGLKAFLLCWVLSPLLLFTFSGNILPAYVLPSIPAMGILITILLSNKPANSARSWVSLTACITPLLLIVATVAIYVQVGEKRSDKVLFDYAHANTQTFYVGKRPFSGQFYSQGQAKHYTHATLLPLDEKFQLIGTTESVQPIIQDEQLSCIQKYTAKSGRSLFYCGKL